MKKKISLFPILLTTFVDLLGISIIIPILAPLFLNTQSNLFSPSTDSATKTLILGLLIAVYPLTQFFGAPILGSISDNIGRKKVLIISLIGTIIGYIILAAGISTQHIILLFIGRALDGFTGGNISTVYSAIADVSDEKDKPKNFGLVGIAVGLGFILGPFIGGMLSAKWSGFFNFFDYATPFWFAVGLATLNLILVIIQFPETLKTRTQKSLDPFTGFKNLKKAATFNNLKIIFAVSFMLNFGFNLFVQFFSVYLIMKFKITQLNIGYMFAYIGLWIAISQGIIVRLISKKFKPKNTIFVSIVLLMFSFLLILIPKSFGQIFIVIPFIAIFQGLIQPNITTIISDLGDSGSQGEIMGIAQSIAAFAQIVPPIIDGLIVSIHITMPIIFASGATLISLLLFARFYFSNEVRKGRNANVVSD